MKTKLKITGNWNDIKTNLKKQYPTLTDADLSFSAGKEDVLVTSLANTLDKTEEEVIDMIEDFQSTTGTGKTPQTPPTPGSETKTTKKESSKDTSVEY